MIHRNSGGGSDREHHVPLTRDRTSREEDSEEKNSRRLAE
jgi:hypothetical protein